MRYLVHLGYVITLLAFLVRDILLLRSLLIVAQVIVASYALSIGVPTIAAWNTVFLFINIFWVVRILLDRRAVKLPADVKALYDRHFAAMTPPEFLRWWQSGHRETLTNAPLARAGTTPEALYFLLNGSVQVTRHQVSVTDLPAGFFVAEMSLLTGQPATADVDAVGEVEVMRWASHELRALRARSPALWTRIQSVIGHDLVEKIQRAEVRTPGVEVPHPVSSEVPHPVSSELPHPAPSAG